MLLSFITQETAPTPDEVERELGLLAGTVDRTFGVVEIDERAREYTIRIAADTARHLRASERFRVVGTFSDPGIDEL